MNLFILDIDPVKAAKLNCDKHVCKIILEVAQMLCLARIANGLDAPWEGKSHLNNHVSKWVRENMSNYNWTVEHGLALCDEYTRRYEKDHKTRRIIEWCRDNPPSLINAPMTPFRQAVAEDCYDADPVRAYIKYYNRYKARFCKWTLKGKKGKRIPFNAPSWFKNEMALATSQK